jgi:hypothetical protein
MSVYGRIASYHRSMDEYNKTLSPGLKKKNRLNENNVRRIIMLLQYKTFDELVKEGIISKRSKYNYLSKLKKIGIAKNSFPEEVIDIEGCENFTLYYETFGKIILNL